MRPPWRRFAGPIASVARAARATSMGSSTAAGSSVISAAAAAIRPHSQSARACRPPNPQASAQQKLTLTTWFLAFYLIGQAKTGISSLELSRHLGVNYGTAWLLHNKTLRAMADREEDFCCGERSRSMMPSSAENDRAVRQVADQRTRYRSSLPSP